MTKDEIVYHLEHAGKGGSFSQGVGLEAANLIESLAEENEEAMTIFQRNEHLEKENAKLRLDLDHTSSRLSGQTISEADAAMKGTYEHNQ